MFEAGKKYVPADHRQEREFTCVWASDTWATLTYIFREKPSAFSLPQTDFCVYKEYVEPRKGVGYFNAYDNALSGPYATRSLADRAKSSRIDRLACVKVEWAEGQFDV